MFLLNVFSNKPTPPHRHNRRHRGSHIVFDDIYVKLYVFYVPIVVQKVSTDIDKNNT